MYVVTWLLLKDQVYSYQCRSILIQSPSHAILVVLAPVEYQIRQSARTGSRMARHTSLYAATFFNILSLGNALGLVTPVESAGLHGGASPVAFLLGVTQSIRPQERSE